MVERMATTEGGPQWKYQSSQEIKRQTQWPWANHTASETHTEAKDHLELGYPYLL